MQFSVLFIFNWRIITLQFCVVFCHTSTWNNHKYIYVSSLLNLSSTPHPMAPLKIVIEHLSWSLSAIQQIPTGYLLYILYMGFPGSSAGKVSSCNAGDPSLIPGLGRSLGEGKGYPLQYSWASLMAQLVKNSPAMWEIWVWSLGWEDPLEKGKATHSSILAWKIPRTV